MISYTYAISLCCFMHSVLKSLSSSVAVASTEKMVQNLEEKTELNDTIERLKAQFAAVSNNLEVQAADNSQLSRYSYTVCTQSPCVYFCW